MKLLHLGSLEFLSLIMRIRIEIFINLLDIVVMLGTFQLFHQGTKQGLIIVHDFQRLASFEVAHDLLLIDTWHRILGKGMFASCRWSSL